MRQHLNTPGQTQRQRGAMVGEKSRKVVAGMEKARQRTVWSRVVFILIFWYSRCEFDDFTVILIPDISYSLPPSCYLDSMLEGGLSKQ